MTIQHSTKSGDSYNNSTVKKVSLSVKGDIIFMSKEERYGSIKRQVNELLATKNLIIVESKWQDCKNGNCRTFIGDLNYVADEATEIE